MSLLDVAYQGKAQRLIQRALSRSRVPHAYLFHGPDGVGKEAVARGLAELLLCPRPVEHELDAAAAERLGLDRLRTGCGSCEDCRCLAAGTHPDLHTIHRQLNRQHPDEAVRRRKGLEIGIGVVQHFLIEKVWMTSVRGRAKVFIVREADRITRSAQNAMLKCLEEPPGPTYLILLVTSPEKMLPTTLSRCHFVSFLRLPTAFVEERLGAIVSALHPVQVAWYARLADGSIGRAVELARDDVYAVNERLISGFTALADGRNGRKAEVDPDAIARTWLDEAGALAKGYAKRDPDISPTEATRRGVKAIFQLAAAWYADILRRRSAGTEALVNSAHQAELATLATARPPMSIVSAVSLLARAEAHLDQNVNVQLCVETLVGELARGTLLRATH